MDKIDFAELPLQTFREDGTPDRKVMLRKGKYAHQGSCLEEVTLKSVHPLKSADGTHEFALAIYERFEACGSSTEGIALVFDLYANQLTVRQELDWDEHFGTRKPFFSYSGKSEVLVIRTAHYVGTDAHCCVSAVDVVELRWDGSGFVKKVVWTELSTYAEEQGLTLRDLLAGNSIPR